MKKILGIFLAFFLFYFLNSPVRAFDNTKAVGVFNLPDEAKTKDVVSLGHFKDPKTGRDVQGYAFIHGGSGKSKNLGPGLQNNTQPNSATGSAISTTTSVPAQCFSYTPGARWKTFGMPWVINPQNTRGLTSQFLLDTEGADIAKWEDAADGTVGDGKAINILGNGSITNEVLTGNFNGQNEVFFGQSSVPGAVAVTIAWGYFDGNLSDRRIIEWEQIYNDIDYDFSTSGEVGKYDFEEISTHEVGHIMGLWDQYDPSCLEATMYGYTSAGEIKKRTLEAPDIGGIKELYEPIPCTFTNSAGLAQKYGDVNNNNVLNVADAILVLRSYFNIDPKLTGDAFKAADVNGNGIVNASDATLIKRVVFGIDARFSVCP